MAYLSLYRKYRSQSFEDVQGQDHVTRTLQNAIRAGRVAHAYLFCGPRGTGKTSTARLLAKALNCEQNAAGEPCNTCTSCIEITEGRHLDVREIDAASNRGIDDIRDLRDTVAFAPSSGRNKIYVIDEVHQVTNEGFNALLKTLEEPPPRVVFILATTETHKMPATIVSRCQRFEFRRASVAQLRDRVAWVASQEGATIEPAALELIARDANGGWRDALSILEQVLAFSDGTVTAKDVYAVLGTVEADTLHEMAGYVVAQNGGEVFSTLDRLICEGKDPRQLLRDITSYYRSAMLAAAGSPPPGDAEQVARFQEQGRQYGQLRLIQAIEVLAQTEREARWSEQPRLLLELALVRLMHPRQAAAQAPAAQPSAQPAMQAAARPSQPAPARRPEPVRADQPRSEPQRRDSAAPAPRPASHPAIPSASPFVDEAPPVSHGSFSMEDELPPPPLTVGDARAGADGGDDYDALFGTSPTPTRAAQPAPRPPAPTSSVSEPTPEPLAAPLTSAPAAGSIDLIRKKWRVVMEELKRAKKLSVYMFLSDAEAGHFEGEELVLLFPSKSFAEEFPKRGKAFSDPLIASIAKVTGVQCRIRAQHKGTAPAPPPRSSAPPPPAAGQAPVNSSAVAPSAQAPNGNGASNGAAAPAPPSGPRAGAPGQAGPAPTGLTGEDLTHSIIDIYDGQIMDDREM